VTNIIRKAEILFDIYQFEFNHWF